MNKKTINLLGAINFSLYCLMNFATLYNFCNHVHCFTKIVRRQKILFERINGAFCLFYRLECKQVTKF